MSSTHTQQTKHIVASTCLLRAHAHALMYLSMSSCVRDDPATLSYVIQAVNKYTDDKRAPSRKRDAHAPTSLNSVLHLLESADQSRGILTPTATRAVLRRWQCRHCSYVYDGGQHTDGEHCFMCAVGTIAKARVGAHTNPDVYKSAMEVANRASRANTASADTSHNRTRAYIPAEWPRGRNCDACNHRLAVMYCSSCTATPTQAHIPTACRTCACALYAFA